jgi:hypothetical protein
LFFYLFHPYSPGGRLGGSAIPASSEQVAEKARQAAAAAVLGCELEISEVERSDANITTRT